MVILALCLAAIVFSDDISQIKEYGYLGIFVISIFAGGTVIVQVPGLLIIFTSGSLLHPAIVDATAGLGEAIGVVAIYLAGFAGQGALERVNNWFAVRFERWICRQSPTCCFTGSH